MMLWNYTFTVRMRLQCGVCNFVLFPGMMETVRKITLSRAMRTMQDLFPLEYNFYPRSWILPEELPLFMAEVHNFDSQNTVTCCILYPCYSLVFYLPDYLKLHLGMTAFLVCLGSVVVWMLALFVMFWNKLQISCSAVPVEVSENWTW